MFNKRELNLLPQEVKSRYFKKNAIKMLACLGGIIGIGILFQLIVIMVLNLQIRGIRKANEQYNTAKQEITEIQNSIEEYNSVIKCYENEYFPFSQFMSDLNLLTPEGVKIISADTRDRLVNEGANEDEDENETAEDNSKNEDEDDSKKNEDENGTENGIRIDELPDLSGNEIVIRGYGTTQDGISKFIYGLSNLRYIRELNVTAIEEHKIENGTYNIFEITVIGG